jgi:CHRD domain
MRKLLTVILGAVLATAGFTIAVALAAPQEDTVTLKANLKARFEVPRPSGVPAGATGAFTGTAVELANDRARVRWRLTFAKLSGRAMAAHIHRGRAGRAGPVLVALCGPCRSGQRGTARISHAQLRTIRAGGTYVNVHTAKNAAGEIRGQVKASGGSGTGSDSTDTTTTTTTEPPPYP